MVLSSQVLLIFIRWLDGEFMVRDGCDGFPMADLKMPGKTKANFNSVVG